MDGFPPAPPPTSAPGPVLSNSAAQHRTHWFVAHTAGLAALALGVAAFCVVSLTQDKFWATPNWHLTVPFFVVTTAVGAVSFVRREGAVALPLLGIGLAAAAVVLGWFLITAIVVAATAFVILLLSHAL